jgi:glucokinase
MTDASFSDTGEHTVLGDIGGTNARFAVLSGDRLGPIEHLAVRDYMHFADALAAFLARRPSRHAIHRAIFGVAGVVEGDRSALTNNSWVVDAAELGPRFGLTEVYIINDFEALAWSLPHLTRDDTAKVGGGESRAKAPMLVLGPGTGLGVAAYVPSENGALVLRSEGGHASIPSGSLREDAVIKKLRGQFGHVSAERVLSGPGLENLYRVLASIDALPAPQRSAAEIAQAALEGNCATSRAALDVFCAMLGDVAGNFALSFGAQGGVFIAGGIVPRIRDYLYRSQFRARFEAKGRMQHYVEDIPVYLILCDDPAFIGLRSLALQLQ